jgi:hypothetical protein
MSEIRRDGTSVHQPVPEADLSEAVTAGVEDFAKTRTTLWRRVYWEQTLEARSGPGQARPAVRDNQKGGTTSFGFRELPSVARRGWPPSLQAS